MGLMLLFVLLFIYNGLCTYELLPYNPHADPRSVVISGHARFTILTSRMIRAEYSSDAKFEDRATLAVVNRFLPVVPFAKKFEGGWLTITTTDIVLKYKVNSANFSSSLLISPTEGNKNKFAEWHFGDDNEGNLLGTVNSLDEVDTITLNCSELNFSIHEESLHCEWGLVSRRGWAVIDDSENWCTKNDWWDGKNHNENDIYFLGHGLKYTDALKDFIAIGGKMAMPPRATTGIFWSKWNNLNDEDVKDVVTAYEKNALPLDVFVLDMDWHTKHAWGGYTWDERLFPMPSNSMDWLHHNNIIVGANIHDDNGIMPHEKKFKEMANILGWKNDTAIPFQVCTNKNYNNALEDVVLKSLENEGIDFWWIDWQQGGTRGGCEGGKQNPTFWLNKMRATDNIRRNSKERAFVLGRWGGLGNHRYQIGFSGDVVNLTWQSLAYQPYFSYTASNVGYGFWSHDIVGPPLDHELHTRWVQWGAFSAIFRTHDRGMAGGLCALLEPESCAIVEVWEVPSMYAQANKDAIIAREKLIPYIYNATRDAYDNGVSIIRPMYYDFPQYNEAYLGDGSGKFSQYMFGEHIMVAPVVAPASKATLMSDKNIWIPPGKWYSITSGQLYTTEKGKFYNMSFGINNIPIFYKGGSIITEIPINKGDYLGLAQRQYNHIVVSLFPGKPHFYTSLYEDDGHTTDYVQGKFTRTNISYVSDQTSKSIRIDGTPVQPFDNFPKERKYTIKLVDYFISENPIINNEQIPYNRYGGPNSWHFDGMTMTTIIETKEYSTKDTINILVKNPAFDFSLINGMSGIFKRCIKSKSILDKAQYTPGQNTVLNGRLMELSSAAERLSYLVKKDMGLFISIVRSVPKMYSLAVKEIQSIRPPNSTATEYKTIMRNMKLGGKKQESREIHYPRLQSSENPKNLFRRWNFAMQLLTSLN